MDQTSEWIDGKYLVITDRTALPPRCVQTNQPVSEHECQTLDLPWLPTALKIAMCLVPFLLLFGPYAVRRRCRGFAIAAQKAAEEGNAQAATMPAGFILPQVHQLLDVLAAIDSYTSVTYLEDDVWVTHSELHVVDGE